VWLEAGGGFEHIGLHTLEDDLVESGTCDIQLETGCVDADSSPNATSPTRTGTGGFIEAGAGAHLSRLVTLGLRGRVGFFADFDLARIGPELGVRIPVGDLEPRIHAGFGYAALINVAASTGYYARLGGGLDWLVSRRVSLGGDLSADLVGLSRPTIDAGSRSGTTVSSPDEDVISPTNTSGVGLGVALGVHVGVHF
jgi:hypothetical protein